MMQQPPPEYYDQQDSDNVCFLCDDPDYERVYRVEHFGFPFEFQRCQCGMVKQTPMPNEAFFEWFFNSDLFISARKHTEGKIWGFYDYFRDEESRLKTSKYRYWRLKRYFRSEQPLEILKIGPSTGTFLHVAQLQGHHALGVDISSEFVKYAYDQYQVDIRQGRFERLDFPPESFDVILLFNVIENIPNLAEFLAAVRRALKPGGLFIFNHVEMKGNLLAWLQKDRYFLYRPPICYIFDRNTIRTTLDKFGFTIEKSIRDLRYMTIEKIVTLLGWRWPLRLAETLGIARISFPIYAYPSRISVARKG